MFPSGSWHFTTESDFIVLIGIATMIAGGAALIASSVPMRGEALAQRVNFALPARALRSSVSAGRASNPVNVIQQLPSLEGGLSSAEHRQVIRLFSYVGVASDRAVPCLILVRLIVAGIFAASTATSVKYVPAIAAYPMLPTLAAVGAAVVGWIAPILFIDHLIKRRIKTIASGLPNALELLVVCVEAGLSLEDGLQRVARELQLSQPALSEELALTWAEVNILPDRTQALVNLAERIDNSSVRSVVGMLSQSLRYGTPLAQSLRVGATEMRNDQMTLLEERASRLPALMTIPVMLFIMPTIFLIIAGPAVMRVMDMWR